MVCMIAEDGIDALNAWLARAGLRGEPEAALVNGFCERAVAAGLPISRALVLIDTLHPIYEGRVVRWGHDPSQPVVQEYGRTGSPGDVSDLHLSSGGEQPEVAARWRASPFFRMSQTGESLLRRRVTAKSEAEFPVLRDYRAAGMTEYVAMIDRFAPEGIIGEMDCVYSSWVTAHADGFADAHIAALTRVVPTLALAVKAAALARMTGTLMETYLGRDAGRRVLSGRIIRGVAERIDAVIWFSDLRGFTRITDSAPEQVIPLLNDYADVIVSAIHAQGGDVLKLIGDGMATASGDRDVLARLGDLFRLPQPRPRTAEDGVAEFDGAVRELDGERPRVRKAAQPRRRTARGDGDRHRHAAHDEEHAADAHARAPPDRASPFAAASRSSHVLSLMRGRPCGSPAAL
jgi:class 3 adenylate cyclase